MGNVFIFSVVALSVYLWASIPWGFVIGKVKGIDIREHGSGNIGATNVTRVLGRKYGRMCFLFDLLKGLLPVFIVKALEGAGILTGDGEGILLALTAFACVAGHVWSVYLGFKGGKGIATSAGVLLALAPFSLIFSAIVWVLVFYAMRYVSLASICAAAALPLTAVVFSQSGLYPMRHSVIVLITLLSLLTVVRHASNVRRLINGTENRFSKK